jgi:hypothetical protein
MMFHIASLSLYLQQQRKQNHSLGDVHHHSNDLSQQQMRSDSRVSLCQSHQATPNLGVFIEAFCGSCWAEWSQWPLEQSGLFLPNV